MNKYKSLTILFLFTISIFISLNSCSTSEKKVNILVIFPFTGEAASYGKILKDGIEVALSEIKDDAVRAKINVIYRDSKLSTKEVVNIYQQETALHKIAAVLPASTADVLTIGPLCNKDKVVCLPPLADGDKITESGPYVFRISPSSSFQAKVLAEAVKKNGYNETAVLYLNDAWGQGLAQRFKTRYETQGGKVISYESVVPNQTDLRAQLSKIKFAKSRSIVILLHPPETIPALKQIRELGLKVQIFGGDNFSNKDIYNIASDVAQGVIFALPAEPNNVEFHNFSEEYYDRTGNIADINAAAAYDAIKLLITIINKGFLTGEQIQKSLMTLGDGFQGATGLIKWDSKGEIISKVYQLYLIKNNKYIDYEE